MILEKVKHNQQLTEQEQELLNELIISREKNETEIEKTKMLVDGQKQVAAMRPKPTASKK